MRSRNVLIKNRYIFFLLTIIIFILFFFAVESSGSQTVYRSRTLEDLIRVSQYILVVKEAKPFFTVKEIDITPKGKEKNKRKYPPFEKRIFHYEVIETLYHGVEKKPQGFIRPAENESKSSIPKSIDVIQANMEIRLKRHRQYYIDSIKKSPIYRRYEPEKVPESEQLDPVKSDKIIIFLRQNRKEKNMYQFTVVNAVESIKNKEKIIKLISEIHKFQ